ncbi:MAG: hypothetical protein IT416_05115 [Candidatus Pacebacteria bacterium]|jgi:hypothetical protein|nr:hypothetical protein [Candidatus Paceibacterota bacterium]
MQEATEKINPEAIKHNFLRALEQELAGFDYEVVIEQGVGLVVSWGSTVKKEDSVEITSKLYTIARKLGVEVETFLSGIQKHPSRIRFSFSGAKVYGLFLLFDDNKDLQPEPDWQIVQSDDETILSIGLKQVSPLTGVDSFLKAYAKMVAFAKQKFAGEKFDIRFGLAHFSQDLLKLEFKKTLPKE